MKKITKVIITTLLIAVFNMMLSTTKIKADTALTDNQSIVQQLCLNSLDKSYTEYLNTNEFTKKEIQRITSIYQTAKKNLNDNDWFIEKYDEAVTETGEELHYFENITKLMIERHTSVAIYRVEYHSKLTTPEVVFIITTVGIIAGLIVGGTFLSMNKNKKAGDQVE